MLPYSQLVFDMQKTNPEVYVSRVVLRLKKDEADVVRLRSGIEQAIGNHPAFQMHIDAEGWQHYAPQADVLHGQYHSIDIIEKGENVSVYIKMDRILGDAISDGILIDDIVRAYKGLPLQKDYYLEYLQRKEEEKRTARYVADRQWLEAEYGQISCPVHPNTDAPILKTDKPIEGQLPEDYSDLRNAIRKSGEKTLLSLNGFFSLASALAIMEYNGTDEAGLTWAYEGREKEDEQRIYGSLHRDVPFKISNFKSPVANHKSHLIREARNQIRRGIAHSSYPLTLTKPHTEIWDSALNVLVQPSFWERLKDLPFSVEIVESAVESNIAYSLLDVEIYDAEQLIVNYRYSATHYKPESIQKFAALVRKYVEWLLEGEK